MTEVVTQKKIGSHLLLCGIWPFQGEWWHYRSVKMGTWISRWFLFRLHYGTHSLQMYPKWPCRYVFTLTLKLSERQYALRLVGVPCQHLSSTLPFFQPTSPSPSSNISSVAFLYILRHRIHPCCPASPPPCLSAAVFTANLVQHLYYPASPPRLHCYPPRFCCSPYCIIFHHSVYFAVVVCLPSPIVSSPCSALICTTLFAPICSTLIFLLSSLIFSIYFSFLFWHISYLSLWYSSSAPICWVFLHLPLLCSAPIWSSPSDLSAPIGLLHLYYAKLWLMPSCSNMLARICFDQLNKICSVFCSSGPSNFS